MLKNDQTYFKNLAVLFNITHDMVKWLSKKKTSVFNGGNYFNLVSENMWVGDFPANIYLKNVWNMLKS